MIAHVLLAAVAIAVAQLDADIHAVAALPGEPRLVSAAGLTSDNIPLLTIENRSPFDGSEPRRRVVIIGGAVGDTDAARGVLTAVRWFKTSAPALLRQRWTASALPFADLGNPHVRRWIDFQAADLVIQIHGSGDPAGPARAGPFAADAALVGSVPVVTTRASSATETMRRELRSSAVTRSTLRDTIVKRVSRAPLDLAAILAKRYPQAPVMSYIPAVAWVSTLRLAAITGDASLRTKVLTETQQWVAGEKKLFGAQIPLTAVAGTMIFAEIADADSAASPRALAIEGATLASAVKESGIATYGQGWTDDMFMASAILARSARLTGRERDLDAAARLLIQYADRLQRPDGIFVHATDGPFAWGRGNGFAALGLMEVLTALPERHEARGRVLDLYRRQMAALKGMQAPDGAWRQVIDEPAAYREETATAMLATAMARGIRLGWIDRTYADTVRRAWRALLAHVGDDGSLVDVCAGTGAGPTKEYYLDRPAITGFDDRGGAMALAASVEIYELSRRK